jgi:serine/threonine protein phosphatase PrpC
MASAITRTGEIPGAMTARPDDEELDLFGITHTGKVRKDNQDHYLIGTLHQTVQVHGTSLPNIDQLPLRGRRLGTFALVADGVGGSADGSEAARLASETVMRYVTSTLQCYHASSDATTDQFHEALRAAALQAHDAVRAEAATRPGARKMATTLTFTFSVWPWMYVVQLGDSRCYFYVDGKLQQITRDQTVAQMLYDQGALKREDLERTPLRNVLASAVGGDEATPEVTRVNLKNRSCATLLCSDGLTKHVSAQEIEDHIRDGTSAEQICRDLLQLALDRGGSDNITILVGRAPVRPGR